MAGVYRQSLMSLQENTQNALIIGIIISSSNPRVFEMESPHRSGTRGVWTFTLRDSENDTINVTVWGSVQYVNNLAKMFQIGSVVDVINPKVIARKIGDKNEIFVPTVSSPYSLTVNENAALIQEHEYSDRSDYEELLRLPIRNISNLRCLSSIMENLEALLNQFVDIVLVVTFIGECRTIRTKDGRTLITRDFEATDGSYTQDTVAFKLWDNDWVQRSENWEPKNTVILLTDAQIIFDKYKKKTSLMIVRKTLITENPNVPQTTEVRKSIKPDSEYMPHDPYVIPKNDCITNIMTIMEITEKVNQKPSGTNDRVQFMTLLYAQITEMNLENNDVVVTRCALCKRIIIKGDDSCRNLECPCGNGRRDPENIKTIYLRINLKDKTGYLVGCRLTGAPAELALGCDAEEFGAMTLGERDIMKAKFFLKQFDIKLQVLGPSQTFPRALYNILSMNPCNENYSENNFFDGEPFDY
ncbi:hypothetical protein PV327_007980 [Microctonus hyperodae]|uniref:MEIOB-like N-terminal domain-containing protein n=1 Tax=Microctonus hyperodae TaxID=165561 RepID=A0AA39G0K8_MICHY|nr:hypothetical protein PV327_007980 [Microctonus hyperodae]